MRTLTLPIIDSFVALSITWYLIVCSVSGLKVRLLGRYVAGVQVFPTAPIQYLLLTGLLITQESSSKIVKSNVWVVFIQISS